MKLRARFTALFAILAAATVAVLVLVSDAVVGRAVSERVAERFGRELEHLAEDLARGDVPETGRDDFLRAAAKQLECRVTYIAPGGRVLDDTDLLPADVPSMENHAGREEVRQAVEGGTGRSRRISPTEQRPMLYVARKLPDGSVLRLAVSEARLRQVELAYLWAMRLAIAAACLVLFLIGSAASRRFSEPIAELTRSAAAIAAGDFARDLPRAGGEEVQLLSGAVQRMKDSLNAALERAEGERRLAAMVFETLPDGLVVVDAKLKVLESNERFAVMTGVPTPAGRGVYELLREKPLYDCFETTARTGEMNERTVRLADDRVWQITVAPLPPGHRAAAVGVLRDVSRLEKTEAMRRTFVGDVSHELRTPIASIAAAAETLAEGAPDRAETAELLGLIRRQSDRMRELIDDLMDLAQIESGAVPLEREEIPLQRAAHGGRRGPRARGAGASGRGAGGRRRFGGGRGRPPADRAARAQSDRQRDQVLTREGPGRGPRLAPGRALRLLRRGPRARDPEGRAGPHLPALLPGRPVALEGPAGIGPRARDRQAHRATPRSERRRRGRSRAGKHLPRSLSVGRVKPSRSPR